jgi:hypothetical protein
MPFAIDISTEDQFGRVTGIGDLNIPPSVKAVEDLIDHPDFQPHYGIIVDFRQTATTARMSELRDIAAAIRQYRNPFQGRIALIVNPKEVRKASTVCMMVRVFGIKMEAYGEMESALKYLATGQSWYQSE